MIVPGQRLVLLALCVLLPATAAMTLWPSGRTAAMAVIATVMVVAAIDVWLGQRKAASLDVSAPALVRLRQGETSPLILAVLNRSMQPVRLRFAVTSAPELQTQTQEALTVLAETGRTEVAWLCEARARGNYAAGDAFLELLSPLRLWQVTSKRALACEIRVYPSLRNRATAALLQRVPSAGMRVYRQVGKGREFDRLRHYLPGDSYEDVYWKGTAKRGAPVVKLHQVEQAQQVYVAVDCSRLSGREGVLDGYVNAALHLALAADSQGDRFGLITYSNQVHSMTDARGGASHFQHCREAIYSLRTRRVNPDFGELFSLFQSRVRRRALLVLLTSLDDALLAESFEREVVVVGRRHLVTAHVMRTSEWRPVFEGSPPANVEEAYSRLARQLAWNRMRRLQIALQNRGVRLSMLDPEHAEEQIAATYLDVKRRQLL